jgi:hypothetical protein
MKQQLKQLAAEERRTVSQLAAILIEEALEGREDAAGSKGRRSKG